MEQHSLSRQDNACCNTTKPVKEWFKVHEKYSKVLAGPPKPQDQHIATMGVQKA